MGKFDADARFDDSQGRQDFRVRIDHDLTWTLDAAGNSPTIRQLPERSETVSAGQVTEIGPPMNITGLLPVCMFVPRHCLFWGRPGEDWRLTERISTGMHPGIANVELESVEGLPDEGRLAVDLSTGFVLEQHLPGSAWTLNPRLLQ